MQRNSHTTTGIWDHMHNKTMEIFAHKTLISQQINKLVINVCSQNLIMSVHTQCIYQVLINNVYFFAT